MGIYLFIILMLGFFSLTEISYKLSRQLKFAFGGFSYLALIFLVGFRWETGTDWEPYLLAYNAVNGLQSLSSNVFSMEVGYRLLVFISKTILNEYTFFLILHSIIYYFFIFRGLSYLSPFFFVTLLLFYAFTIGVMGSHRQLIALCIILFSLRYVLQRKPLWFVLSVSIAFFFHTTAIVCIIFYFLNRNISPIFMVIIMFTAIIVGKSNVPLHIFGFFGGVSADKVAFYLDTAKEFMSEYKLTTIGLIKRLVFIFVFIYNSKKIRKELPHYNFMLNAYFIGLVIYFLFSSTLLILVNRGSLYFNVFEPILIGSQFILFSRRENKLVLFLGLFLFTFFYFFQSIASYSDLFIPYKGLFINEDYIRDLY